MNLFKISAPTFGADLSRWKCVLLSAIVGGLLASACTPKIKTTNSSLNNPASAANILSGLEAIDGTGAVITGTMPDRGTWDARTSWPGAGSFGATPSNQPSASQIARGSTVMGTAGTSGTTLPEFIGTSLFKTTVTATSTMYAEVNLGTCSDTTYVNRVDCENASGTWTPSAPGAGYYEQANRGLGHYSNTSTVAPGTAALRPTTNCGSTGSIQARIADCVTQNTTRASWDGGSQSTSGLGTWSLVSRIGASKEVWRDNRTGFLWSSVVSTGINWCRVTGNTENIAGGNCTPGAGTDCNGVACQPASPQSACFEGAGLSPTDGAEVWATGTYSAAKGEMGLNSATKVRWRAPLFRDYMIARYNGLEFVMPDWGGAWYGSLWGNNYLVREDGFGHALGGAFGNGSARCVGR